MDVALANRGLKLEALAQKDWLQHTLQRQGHKSILGGVGVGVRIFFAAPLEALTVEHGATKTLEHWELPG